MSAQELWRSVLTAIFRSEFGPGIAAELAALPLHARRERIRAWHLARPSSHAILLAPDRWAVVRFKREILRIIAREQAGKLSPAVANEIEGEIAALEAAVEQPAELPIAEQRLMRAEQILAYASAASDFPPPAIGRGRRRPQEA